MRDGEVGRDGEVPRREGEVVEAEDHRPRRAGRGLSGVHHGWG